VATTTVTVNEPTVPTPAPDVTGCDPNAGSRKQKLTAVTNPDGQSGMATACFTVN
jgi:hypothetical protein